MISLLPVCCVYFSTKKHRSYDKRTLFAWLLALFHLYANNVRATILNGEF